MTAPAAGTATPASKPKRRRWRRLALIALGLALVARLVLGLMLPTIIDWVARGQGLTVAVGKLDLSLLGGHLEAWNVVVHPAPADGEAPSGEPLLDLQYADVDVNMSALLVGALHVHRVELDGADLRVARDANGRLNWATAEPDPDATDPEPQPPEPAAEPEPFAFGLPVEISAVRAQNLRVHATDAMVEPAFAARVDVNLAVTDLGSTEHPTRLQFGIWSPQCLDVLHVDGTARAVGANLDVDLGLRVAGLRPGPLAAYLRAAGVQPHAESLEFDLRCGVHVEPIDESATSCTGSVSIRDVRLRADAREAFGIATIDFPIDRWSHGAIELGEVALRELRAAAERNAEGVLRVAGLDLVGAPAPEGRGDADSEPASDDAASTEPVGSPTQFSIRQFGVFDLELAWRDASIEPVTDVVLHGERIVATHPGSDEAALDVQLRAPGVFESLQIQGPFRVLGARQAVDVRLAATGIAPERLAPYLQAAGLRATISDGALLARLRADLNTGDGHTRGDLSVDNLRLADGTTPLAQASVAVRGLDLSAAGVRAEKLELTASGVPLRREPEGAWRAFGLRAELTETDAKPIAVDLSELRVEIDQFALVDSPTPPAPVRIRLSLADLAEEITLDGTVASDDGIAVDLQLRGRGITLAAVRPLLLEAGMDPALRGAELSGAITATVRDGRTDAAIRDLSLRDADAELFALAEVSIEALESTEAGLSIAGLRVRQPVLHAARDADGVLRVAGIRLPEPTVSATAGAEPGSAPAAAPTPAPSTPPAAAPAATTTTLSGVDIEGVTVVWHDAAIEPPLDARLILAASTERIVIGAGAEPGKFSVTVQIPEHLEALTLQGSLQLDPAALDVRGDLDVRGLRDGPLARYLPDGQRTTLREGRLRAHFETELTRAQAGGQSARVALTKFDYSDGDTALLAFERLALVASRLDPAGKVITIDEVALTGLAARASRTDAETIEAMGLAIGPPESPPAPAPATPVEASATAAPTLQLSDDLPTIELRKLSIEVAELTWHDATGAAQPLLAQLQIENSAPWQLMNTKPEELPPLELQLTAKVPGAIKDARVTVRAAPFATDPEYTADLHVRGIDAEQATQVLPGLSGRMRGDEMRDGELTAHLHAQLRVRRRSPTDPGFSQPFGADVTLEKLYLRKQPDGEILAGLDGIHAEIAKIAPATGDLHIKLLEVIKPIGDVRLEADGLHVVGFVIPNAPADAATPPAEPAPQAGEATDTAPSTEAVAARSQTRIDELVVSGLDFRFEDRTVTPPLVVPLQGLDLEVRGFTTRAFEETRPIRFQASLSAGKIDLPERDYSSLFGGFFGAAAQAIGGGADEHALEPRPLFDEIATSGRLVFHPALEGRAQLSLSALELLGFSGPANAAGVNIGDGVLDAGLKLRFQGEAGSSVDSRFVFQFLSLDEPADGPISRYLKLPAPLDTVLFVLRNSEGEHAIPLGFDVDQAGIGGGQIATAAATALGSMITDAITSSAFRVAGSLTDLAGVTGGPEQQRDLSTALRFTPLETAIDLPQRLQLQAIANHLLEDETLVAIVQHELGGGDVTRAAQIANPGTEQTLALATQLRATKAELLRRRAERAAAARVQLSLGNDERAREARIALASIERELGRIERALDEALELVRPGADRRATRRTREACRTIAERRLQTVRRALIELLGPDLADRVELRKPRFVPAEGDAGGRVLIRPKARAQ